MTYMHFGEVRVPAPVYISGLTEEEVQDLLLERGEVFRFGELLPYSESLRLDEDAEQQLEAYGNA